MPLDPVQRSKLLQLAAYLLSLAVVALAARYGIEIAPPALPPITVVVSPGEPGHEATVKVFPGGGQP